MIDLDLERKVADCGQLLKLWRVFHDFFAIAVKGEDITAAKEAQFLEVKSHIAMLHDSFMESLEHDQNIGQNILAIVSRSITLKHVNRMSNAEIKKIEIEWHESYLLLNETVGLLEEKKQELETVSAFSYEVGNIRKKLGYYTNRLIHSTYTKVLFFLAVAAFVLWGVPAVGIYDYRNLRNYGATKEPYYKLVSMYRKVLSSNYPFDDFEHLDRDVKERPPNFTSHNVGGYNKAEIAQLYAGEPGLDIKDLLNQASQFRFEQFRASEKDFQLHMFLFDTDAQAREVEQRFKKWKDDLPESRKSTSAVNDIGYMTSVYRRANLLVLIRTQRPLSERNDYMRLEFGISE
jgi:hypothetical protein